MFQEECMEIGEQDLLQQLFEMEIRNRIKANIQGVSRLCSCPFEVAAKGERRAFPRMKQDLTQPVFIFLGTCWLGVVSPKQSDGGCAKSLTSSVCCPSSPTPHDASPDIDGQGTGLK